MFAFEYIIQRKMFDKSSVFVMTPKNEVFRLEIDRDAQKEICQVFADSTSSMIDGKNGVAFDGNYKPEDKEYLCIKGYQLPNSVMNAIRTPLGVEAYTKNLKEQEKGNGNFNGYPEIKAIFVGKMESDGQAEHFYVAFQRYRREQNLVNLPFCLY